jgi:peptide/nickel transport system permease protein
MRLDEPFYLQFVNYVIGLFHGDMGTSLKSGAPVLSEIMVRLPATLELALSATLVAILVGIPIGVLSATRPNSLFDHFTRVFSLVGVSMPAFLLALILQLIFATYLGWLPVSGRLSPYIIMQPITGFVIIDGILTGQWDVVWSAIRYLVLPTAVLAAFLAATLGRFVRNTMLEVMGEDFVRTVRAKGIGETATLWKHVLPNALIPVITMIGLQFTFLIAGTVLVENVFNLPGLGRLAYQALTQRDIVVMQAVVLFFCALVITMNFLVDMAYLLIDPRLRARAA